MSLNEAISIEEIKKIKSLKNKNASGNKSITNEILTCFNDIMLHKLHQLFNKIIDSATIHEPGTIA